MTVAELHHLSYSSISLYQQCPAKWRFRYLQRVPVATAPALAFGTAFHATLRDYYTSNDPAFDLAATWQGHWNLAIETETIDWAGGLEEETRSTGIRLLSAAPVREAIAALTPARDSDGRPDMERRIELRVPGVPVPVIGYIDFISADGVLYDFKTAGRAWTADQAAGEAQPLFYLAGANQMGLEHRPGVFRHFVAIKSRAPKVEIHETPHSPTEILWLFATVRGVWDAIAAGLFPPNPAACFAYGHRCEFWSLCRGRR